MAGDGASEGLWRCSVVGAAAVVGGAALIKKISTNKIRSEDLIDMRMLSNNHLAHI